MTPRGVGGSFWALLLELLRLLVMLPLLLRLLRLLLMPAPAVAVELMLSDAGAVDWGLEYLAWCLFFGIDSVTQVPFPVEEMSLGLTRASRPDSTCPTLLGADGSMRVRRGGRREGADDEVKIRRGRKFALKAMVCEVCARVSL